MSDETVRIDDGGPAFPQIKSAITAFDEDGVPLGSGITGFDRMFGAVKAGHPIAQTPAQARELVEIENRTAASNAAEIVAGSIVCRECNKVGPQGRMASRALIPICRSCKAAADAAEEAKIGVLRTAIDAAFAPVVAAVEHMKTYPARMKRIDETQAARTLPTTEVAATLAKVGLDCEAVEAVLSLAVAALDPKAMTDSGEAVVIYARAIRHVRHVLIGEMQDRDEAQLAKFVRAFADREEQRLDDDASGDVLVASELDGIAGELEEEGGKRKKVA